MESFVFGFESLKDQQGLVEISLVYYNLLETALQRTVFLYDFAVFVESGRADALDFPTSKSRLEDIGCIK